MDLVSTPERSPGGRPTISGLHSADAAIGLANGAIVFASGASSETRLAADEPVVFGVDRCFAQGVYNTGSAARRFVELSRSLSPSRLLSLRADAHPHLALIDDVRMVVFQGLILRNVGWRTWPRD